MDEDLLIARCKAGDEQAFRELFRRYQGQVYNVVLRILGDHPDAEDVVQEVFIHVVRSLPRYAGRSQFSTWLYRVTVNICLQKIRKRPLDTVSLEVMVPDRMELSAKTEGPERAAERHEIEEAVQAALLALPPTHRAAVVLHDIEGLTEEEIARVLKCPRGTVKSRLYHGRRRLRALLQDWMEAGL